MIDIDKVAKLARLAVTPEQAQVYAGQLGNILGMVEQLQAVDTAGILPMSHPLDMTQRLRADTVTEVDQRDAFQAIAPDTLEGLYRVPKVIE